MAFYEKDFCASFRQWLRIKHPGSGAYELKIATGRSIPFSAVKPHQVDALLQASQHHISHKIADDSIAQKPFDIFSLSGVPAYVVVMFEAKASQDVFYMIPVEKWMEEIQKEFSDADNGRRSLTDIRASQIGSVYSLSGKEVAPC